MDWFVIPAIGCLAAFLGFVGCFVPVLPGPLIAYAALWVLYALGHPPTTSRLVIGGAVLLVVTLLDYILPSVFAKRFKCSGWGVFGCFVGSIVGIFFAPPGIVLGPFLGTVAGELVGGRDLDASLRGGIGALLGFVACVGLKLAAVALFIWWYFAQFLRC